VTKRNYGGPYVEADDAIAAPAAAPTAAPTVELTFDQEIQRAMRDSLVKLIRSGDWCKIDYAARVPLDAAFLRKVQSSFNMDNVLALLTARVEERIADAIFNAMATEVATDVKKIMCNTELREDLRATLRAKMRASAEKVSE
jgi:hypothetical protein